MLSDLFVSEPKTIEDIVNSNAFNFAVGTSDQWLSLSKVAMWSSVVCLVTVGIIVLLWLAIRPVKKHISSILLQALFICALLFTLVIDSMAFYPYNCHLPNLTANGIKTMNGLRHGRAAIKGDSIVRPGTGGNGFSFDECNDLRVKISFSIFSSWINQAIQIHKDVELGNFTFDIAIPDNVRLFSYSRKTIIDRAQKLPENERESFLNSHLLRVEGDSFVVPRSYMPLSNGRPMWGTGEYTIKVKVSESCRFADNSDKARHWREDYKRLRQMQQRSGEVEEYFTTLWNQYGTQLVKSSYSSTLKTALTDLTGLPLTTVSSPAKSRPSSAPGQKK